MRGDRLGVVRRDVVRLFEGDSVAGLGEGDLLDRFATGRDEAAFEALVTRLGPMVLGVARRMLSDPHDVEDVFQATFLVLVRKAGSIRDRDLVAPWLHGVASKVARRARAESARRKVRERVAMVPEAVEDRGGVDSGWLELRGLIDEEIGRLPEAHRRAIVLCDVEGLSREEAALRLGWSLNMVRGRLERARNRLRGRLARRGVAPSGGWMALMVAPPTPSALLLSTTVRASLALASGRMVVGLASVSAVALSRGVSRMMMLSKLKVGLAVLASAGFVAGGSGMLAAQGPGAEIKKADVAPAPAPVGPPTVEAPFQPRPSSDLARPRLEAARRRYKSLKVFYGEGRITIDRLLEASRFLMEAECDVAESKGGRVQALRDHSARVREILAREKAELEVGRATGADVAEAEQEALNAEFALAKELETPEAKPDVGEAKAGAKPPAGSRTKLDQERVAIARRLYEQSQSLFSNARVELAEILEAAATLANAEETVAVTRDERVAAIRRQVDHLKQILATTEKRVEAGRSTQAAVDRARLRLLDAQARLLDVSGTLLEADKSTTSPSGGPVPGLAPGSSPAKKDANPTSLAKAVEVFNKEAMGLEIGRDQPPLTEDEVVAAIRLYVDEGGASFVKGALDDFRMVAETREMPPGMRLECVQRDDRGGDFVYECWSVRIVMAKDGRSSMISIRTRMIRSLTLEEARDRYDAESLKLSQAATTESRIAARQLQFILDGLEERIERKKGKSAAPAR